MEIEANNVTDPKFVSSLRTTRLPLRSTDSNASCVTYCGTTRSPGRPLTARSCPVRPSLISSAGKITVTDNKFIDTPGDAVASSAGALSAATTSRESGIRRRRARRRHYVNNSQGPVTISNNFIDWTAQSQSRGRTNNAMQITAEKGSLQQRLRDRQLSNRRHVHHRCRQRSIARRPSATSPSSTTTSGSAAYGAFCTAAAVRRHGEPETSIIRLHEPDLLDPGLGCLPGGRDPDRQSRRLDGGKYRLPLVDRIGHALWRGPQREPVRRHGGEQFRRRLR